MGGMIIVTVIAIIELIAILALVVFGGRYISNVKRVVDNANSISNGNLDVDDIDTYNSVNDASTEIAASLNSIKNNLNTFIRATKTNVVTLTTAVSELSESAEKNSNGNMQIADEASNVADKTSLQFDIVKDNLSIIETNNSYMNSVYDSLQSINKLLNNSTKNSNDGLNLIEGYQSDVNAMSDELIKINKIMTDFNEEIQRISEIGDFIIGINDQLVLLALNASIEAARAGESGRGFAVVAGQMNEMSIKTKEGMDSINAIVKEIINSSTLVNESIERCTTTYENSKVTFKNVSSSFGVINKETKEISSKMVEIDKTFNMLYKNGQITNEKAKSLYDTSDAISKSTDDISGYSQVACNESVRIEESAQSLENMLVGLQKLLVQFNTAITPVNKDRAKRVKILAISMLDNPFWYGVRNGVYYAIAELRDHNVDVDYVAIDPSKMDIDETTVNALRRAIDEGYDGITLCGFLGAAGPLLKEAISKGIKVIPYNCDCDPSVRRHAVLMPDIEELGTSGAKACARELTNGGKIIVLNGNPEIGTNLLKYNAFMSEIKKNKNIHIIDDIICGDDGNDVYNRALAAIKKNPDADLVYIVLGYPVDAARAIVDSGAKGRMRLVCYDHSQEIFKYIKDGVVSCAIGQDDFAQGHDPIIWLYNNIVDGQQFPDGNGHIKIKSNIADRNNINTLLDA